MSYAAGISGKGRAELAEVLTPGRRFVTPTDVAQALHTDPGTAAKKLSRWAEDGWLRRVRRGLYIGVPVEALNPSAWSEDALIVATAVWSPCYFTGWTSASHWALTDQVFRTRVIKTAGRVRQSEVQLLDHDYLLGHASETSMAWGMKSEWLGDTRVRFANPARTVIDVLDDPTIGGGIRHCGEILATYLDEFDAATLIDYGDRLGNRTVFKRLGYMIEATGEDLPNIIAACQDRLSAGISALDPGGPSGGRRLMKWRLRVNVELGVEEPA